MKKTDLIEKLKTEFEKPFQGWDFSYLTANGRMQESELPWNYRALVEEQLLSADSLLDMGGIFYRYSLPSSLLRKKIR